jgi:16S rRNA C1402 (ribose-2'-O) methylase RsmI
MGTAIARLMRGERVAYVSDAGTPGVSDPGAALVAAVRAAGLRVVAVPGAMAKGSSPFTTSSQPIPSWWGCPRSS